MALNTPAGTPVVAANGISITTAGVGVSLPGGVLVLAGADTPNGVVTAPIGSLFLRTNPGAATERLYIILMVVQRGQTSRQLLNSKIIGIY